MRYFPAFLDLKGKPCVVVGGGRVAERKVKGLLKAGAAVRVISPNLTSSLARLHEKGLILHQQRPFRAADLGRAHLCIAATDSREVNERVYQAASRQRIPVNVVDDPARCSFIVPSLVMRGDLLVAISTSGQSPALAKALRQKLQKEIGPEYALWLKILGAVRKKILPLGFDQMRNQAAFRRLAKDDLLAFIRRRDREGLDRRLKKILGPGFSLHELGVK